MAAWKERNPSESHGVLWKRFGTHENDMRFKANGLKHVKPQK